MERAFETLMSPEGLEEAIQFTITGSITLTQGGKYRVYVKGTGSLPNSPALCYDTLEQANKMLGQQLGLFGAFMSDPKGTAMLMLDALKKLS